MKIQSVVLRADGKHSVVLEDGSSLERIMSLEAFVDGSGMVRVKLEVLMPPALTDVQRAIDSLNLD